MKADNVQEPADTSSGKQDQNVEKVSPDETPEPKPSHNRQPSMSIQSKMRSSSFRRTSLSQGPLSPGANGAKSPDLPVLSPEGDSINSIYRKQAARLDELETENKRLAREAQEIERRWTKTEEELEELREASGEVAELKSRAQKLDAQTDELHKMVSLLLSPKGTELGSANLIYRSKRIHLFSARTPNFNPNPRNDTLRLPAKPTLPVLQVHYSPSLTLNPP